MIELAFIRNELYKGRVTEEYIDTLAEVKNFVLSNDYSYHYDGLILLCIDSALECIKQKQYEVAAEEINLIHNLPIHEEDIWDSDHFFNVQLLNYLEKIEDSVKIRKVIKEVAKFC